MKNLIKLIHTDLFKNSFIYTSTRMINKIIPFIIIPILTQYLSPEDYGTIATFTALTSFLIVPVHLSLIGSVNVNFFRLSREKIKIYIGNVLSIVVLSGLLVFALLYLFLEQMSIVLDLDKIWISISVFWVFLMFIDELNTALWQVEQRSKPFAIYQISKSIFSVSIVLILVTVMEMGWQGKLIAEGSVLLFYALFSVWLLYRRDYLKYAYSKNDITDAIQFGIPLVPHALSSWLKSGADKLIITTLIGTYATGLYAIGFQFAYIIGMLAISFNQAFSPYLYKKLGSVTHEGKMKLVKMTYAYFVLIFVIAGLASIVIPLFILNFLDQRYAGAVEFIPWLSFGFAFYGMYFMVVNYIFYEKKTLQLSLITVSTGVFHAIMSYMLVQLNGAVGAAQATTISFFVTFIFVWRLSAKVYSMPWGLYEQK